MAPPPSAGSPPSTPGTAGRSSATSGQEGKKKKVTGWLYLRRSMYDFFERPETPLARFTNFAILVVICFSILCLITETTASGKKISKVIWFTLEACSTAVFTIEYVFRFISCTEAIPRWKFIFMPSNVGVEFFLTPGRSGL